MAERCYLTDCSSKQFEGDHEGTRTVRAPASTELLKQLEGQTIHIIEVSIPERLGVGTENRPYIEYAVIARRNQ